MTKFMIIGATSVAALIAIGVTLDAVRRSQTVDAVWTPIQLTGHIAEPVVPTTKPKVQALSAKESQPAAHTAEPTKPAQNVLTGPPDRSLAAPTQDLGGGSPPPQTGGASDGPGFGRPRQGGAREPNSGGYSSEGDDPNSFDGPDDFGYNGGPGSPPPAFGPGGGPGGPGGGPGGPPPDGGGPGD